MADNMSNYMGGPRHAPRPEVGGMNQADVGGTSGILNSAGRNRPRKGGVRGLSAPQAVDSPLDLSNQDDIIETSGLGKPADASDRDEDDEEGQDAEAARDQDATFNRDPARPATTGNMATNPDHPLLSRIRSQLPAQVPNFFGAEG